MAFNPGVGDKVKITGGFGKGNVGIIAKVNKGTDTYSVRVGDGIKMNILIENIPWEFLRKL